MSTRRWRDTAAMNVAVNASIIALSSSGRAAQRSGVMLSKGQGCIRLRLHLMIVAGCQPRPLSDEMHVHGMPVLRCGRACGKEGHRSIWTQLREDDKRVLGRGRTLNGNTVRMGYAAPPLMQ